MINQNKILGIIPARGGSKRLPGKNTKDFCGKPLIGWTIEAALKSKYIDKYILSSDDPNAIKIALSYGCEVPFIRPNYLATDDATSLDVVRHALDFFKDQYDYVVLLQPTSPLKTTKDIDAAIEMMLEKNASVCISFCALEKPLSWYYFQDEKQSLHKISDNHQEEGFICYPNGAIYIFSTEWLKNNNIYKSEEIIPYIMPFSKSIDIDTHNDWQLAKYFKECEEY